MRYGADDRPPAAITWLAAAQFTGLIATFIVFPLVLLREAQVPPDTGAAVIALSFVVLGAATALQAAPGIGPGFLLPMTFTAAYLVPAIAAAQVGGLPLAAGMLVFAGCLEAALSMVFRRLRFVFPPEVSGLVVMLVGLTIGEIATRNLAAIPPSTAPLEGWATMLLAFGVTAGLAVWARGAVASFAVLAGLVTGYVAAFALGIVSAPDREAIAAVPIFAMPSFSHLGLAFDPALALPFALAALAATTKAAALASLAQKAAGPRYQGDASAIMARAVRSDGLGTVLAGLFGTVGVNPAPSAAALIVSTGLGSRRIAWAMLGLCLLIAALPPLAVAVVKMPAPVLAGVLLFTGCLVLANGMQMIAAATLDTRRSLVVGLGLFAAVAALSMPRLGDGLPDSLAAVVNSPFIFGSAVALAANLLVQIGPARTVRFIVADPWRPGALDEAWPADPEAAPRAAKPALAALLAEVAASASGSSGPVEITLRTGESVLRARLRYDGAVPDIMRRGGSAMREFVRRHGLRTLSARPGPAGTDLSLSLGR